MIPPNSDPTAPAERMAIDFFVNVETLRIANSHFSIESKLNVMAYGCIVPLLSNTSNRLVDKCLEDSVPSSSPFCSNSVLV